MSIVSSAVDVPKQIVRTVFSPKTLLIGIGVTAATLFVMSRILPGIGQFAGLNTYPWLPQFTDKLAFFPFVPLRMNRNGNGNAGSVQLQSRTLSNGGGFTPPFIDQGAGSRTIADALGYANAMLQVT